MECEYEREYLNDIQLIFLPDQKFEDLVNLKIQQKKINVFDKDNWSLFHAAVWRGVYASKIELVEKLLKAGANVNEEIWRGRGTQSAISYCVFTNSIEIAQLLITHGADINATSCDSSLNETLLISAVKWKRANLINLLLQQPGIDINAKDESGNTAIFHTQDNFELFKVLLDHGADAMITNYSGKTCFNCDLEYFSNEERQKKRIEIYIKLNLFKLWMKDFLDKDCIGIIAEYI